MLRDSNLTEPDRKQAAAAAAPVTTDDFSKLDGAAGGQIPPPRSENERPTNPAWKEIVARYQKPSVGRGVWQIVNTLVPYAALWYLMYLSLSVSYWLVVPLAVLAGAFMVRLFIIYHDCGHWSFFKSPETNDNFGF